MGVTIINCTLRLKTRVLVEESSKQCANKVSAVFQSINENSMKQIRGDLVKEHAKIRQIDPHMFNVEGNSCYNNPIFNSMATPFQAGTVVTITFL